MKPLTHSPLARIRIEAGFHKANDAARHLGYSRGHLLQVEQGRVGASFKLRRAMASLYSVGFEAVEQAAKEAQLAFLKRKIESLP